MDNFIMLLKFFLLAGWIFILLGLAVMATNNRASKVISETSEIVLKWLSSGSADPDIIYKGEKYSPREYLEFHTNKDPGRAGRIESILDVIFIYPKWTNRILTFQNRDSLKTGSVNYEKAKNLWRYNQYIDLFTRVELKLQTFIQISSLEPEDLIIHTQMVPMAFAKGYSQVPQNIKITANVVGWIQDQRAIYLVDKERLKLIDSFLILIVLGAFGSMIFLTRDYITKTKYTTLQSYIFRPIFGMFLAMAMFIFDLLTHSIISTSDISALRSEPLYVLAFAAGLLSEQAYEYVRMRADTALLTLKKKHETD